MSDLHSQIEAWGESAFTRDLFCGATPLSETLRQASARIAQLEAENAARANLDNSARRWHSNADPRLRDSLDTIAAHQRRVADLCHSLAARMGHPLTDSDLLRAALHHDEAEAVLGDMPGPAKERFPALAAAYAKAELQVLTEMGLTWNLTRKDADMLDLCDKLDAYTWACKHGASGDEWDVARAKLIRRAHAIGPQATAWLEDHLTPVNA